MNVAEYLVIESLDGDVAEIELAGGRRFELPLAWLPQGVQEGDGLRAEAGGGGVRFFPDPQAARALREASKQTLLDFSDESA